MKAKAIVNSELICAVLSVFHTSAVLHSGLILGCSPPRHDRGIDASHGHPTGSLFKTGAEGALKNALYRSLLLLACYRMTG